MKSAPFEHPHLALSGKTKREFCKPRPQAIPYGLGRGWNTSQLTCPVCFWARTNGLNLNSGHDAVSWSI